MYIKIKKVYINDKDREHRLFLRDEPAHNSARTYLIKDINSNKVSNRFKTRNFKMDKRYDLWLTQVNKYWGISATKYIMGLIEREIADFEEIIHERFDV